MTQAAALHRFRQKSPAFRFKPIVTFSRFRPVFPCKIPAHPDERPDIPLPRLPYRRHRHPYLFLIIDWYSRKVIDYELSSTLEKGFVLKCLKRAFSHCKPEIMNSDQGSHFTNSDYLELLEKAGVKVSMDGKGRATDNSRTERFFRSLKYECIYINEFEDPRALRQGIARYVQYYNEERPHQSLGEARPVQFYDHNVNQIAS